VSPAYFARRPGRICTSSGYDSWTDRIARPTCSRLRVDDTNRSWAYLNEVRIVKRDNTGEQKPSRLLVRPKACTGLGFQDHSWTDPWMELIEKFKVRGETTRAGVFFPGQRIWPRPGIMSTRRPHHGHAWSKLQSDSGQLFSWRQAKQHRKRQRSTVKAATVESKSTWGTTHTQVKAMHDRFLCSHKTDRRTFVIG